MKTTQRLKQEIFKEVQASGLFKEVQSKLKTQVLSLVEKQSNQNKKQMGFQYEHPLLPKLRKYPLTSLCMDLIQEFLESFKFKYTLSVFKKQINREGNMNRTQLANNFQIEMKNPQNQAVLLSLVSQLVSGDIKVNQNKQNNAFAATNKTQPAQTQPRVNNFIGNNILEPAKPTQDSNVNNFAKKPGFTVQDVSSLSLNDKSKLNNSSSLNNSTSQEQPSSNKPTSSGPSSSINQSQQQTPSSSAIDTSVKPSQHEVSSSKQQSNVKQAKDEKGKKKKKKQVQKPPEGAADLMGELMGKFKTKDTKAEEQMKKNKLFEEKRAFSEQKAKKVLDPSESGANKIRGVSMGKVTGFMSKFMPQSMNPVKNESYIEQEMDEFQQSKDSTRKNPLYSSTESGFDRSGYYDMSVDSNAINDFEYVEKAKKFTKKP